MKARYINPFITASVALFRDFLGMTVEPGKPALMRPEENRREVNALIGLAGETAGAVVLSFSSETACRIVGQMTGQSHTTLDKEVLDGVGELVNIIAGNAKKDLADYRIVISLPGVITGTDYRINWPEGIPVIDLPFASNLGEFSVQVSMRDA